MVAPSDSPVGSCAQAVWGSGPNSSIGVRLSAWHVVGFSAAIAAPVQIRVANPAPCAIVAQRLLLTLIAFPIWRLPFVAVVCTAAARTCTAGRRFRSIFRNWMGASAHRGHEGLWH